MVVAKLKLTEWMSSFKSYSFGYILANGTPPHSS